MSRIRGQHETIAITQDNVTQAGSFAKMLDFSPVPKNDLTETDFIGEAETDFDFQHHGWGGTFTIHESEKSPIIFYNKWVDQNAAGLFLPKTNIVVVTRYVDPGAGSVTTIYQSIVIALDGRPNKGRKDYITNSFKWACKRRKVI